MRLLPASLLLLMLMLVAPGGAAQVHAGKKRLLVLVHGINDHPSDAWARTGEQVLPTAERFVIQLHVKGTKAPEYPQMSSVPHTHIEQIDPTNPRQVAQVAARLAAQPNVSVQIDMPLGLMVDRNLGYQGEWARYTHATAKLVAAIAEAHAQKQPGSYQAIVAHSAGTEVVAEEHAMERHDHKDLFQLSVVQSPRRTSGFKPGTVAILADGDFYYSPGGDTSGAVFRTISAADAEALARKGLVVLRIPTKPTHALMDGAVFAAESENLLAGAAVAVGETFNARRAAHSTTNDLSTRHEGMVVYAPNSATPLSMPATTAGRLVDMLADTPKNRERASVDAERLQQISNEVRRTEPTRGLGGVSLTATASIPIDAEDVAGARYDAGSRRITLLLRDGGQVQVGLPPLDDQSLGDCYRAGYVRGDKPELSMGESRILPVNLHPPGVGPVYYLGGVQDTFLGLALYRADQALGRLTFASSATAAAVADRVPGFRSLPELYPARYTEHPAQASYGGGLRVFVSAAGVEFRPARDGSGLEPGGVRFDVGFGKKEAAEAMFAGFLEAHFREIGETPLGAPLGDLIPFAQSMALFRWLKDHGISLEAGALAGPPVLVYTPREAPLLLLPKLEEVAPRLPMVLFGPFGPTLFIDAQGRETKIAYRDGRATSAERADGSTLWVLRDDLGVPVAITATGRADTAFLEVPEAGLVVAEDVKTRGVGAGTGVELSPTTAFYPINRPEPVVERALARFVFVEERP